MQQSARKLALKIVSPTVRAVQADAGHTLGGGPSKVGHSITRKSERRSFHQSFK